MRMLTLALLSGLAASPTLAQSTAAVGESERYLACLDRVATEPEEAFEDALTWRMHGGGWPARHCEARALIASGDVSGGAAMLEELAATTQAGLPDQLRVTQSFEAGDAWLDAGFPEDARRAFDVGLDLAPEDLGLLTGRARASAESESWSALEADADAIITLAPYLAEGWHYRALARLNQEDLDGAQADVQSARERAPERIDTLVLRGRIIEAMRLRENGG
jgi:tetratricopeptide (TPR) repeat protein